MRLSDDYSPWGKYAFQIAGISITIMMPGMVVAVIGLFADEVAYMWGGIITVILGWVIFFYGMDKQGRELKKGWKRFT